MLADVMRLDVSSDEDEMDTQDQLGISDDDDEDMDERDDLLDSDEDDDDDVRFEPFTSSLSRVCTTFWDP